MSDLDVLSGYEYNREEKGQPKSHEHEKVRNTKHESWEDTFLDDGQEAFV